MKTLNTIENVLIVGGVALSIENIETLLGVVMLSFQIVLIIWKLIYSLYKRVKNKDYDNIEEDIKTGVNALENLSNGTKKDEQK